MENSEGSEYWITKSSRIKGTDCVHVGLNKRQATTTVIAPSAVVIACLLFRSTWAQSVTSQKFQGFSETWFENQKPIRTPLYALKCGNPALPEIPCCSQSGPFLSSSKVGSVMVVPTWNRQSGVSWRGSCKLPSH